MNECVQQFIERRKKEVAKERRKRLATIPEFQIREYSNDKVINEEYPLWDEIKNQPYKISVMDVSDDDFEVIKKSFRFVFKKPNKETTTASNN